MRKRPLGHDLVVAALLLLSCSEQHEKELSRDVAVKVDPARVERVETETTETAGCGCTGGGGGRGAVPLPSCEHSHCSTQHTKSVRCDLVVERDQRAKTHAHCGPNGETDLAVDERGERFAVFSGDAWFVWAGGWHGTLAGGIPRKETAVVFTGPKMDFRAVASAREIVFADVERELAHESDVEPAKLARLEGLFVNLEQVAPEHAAEDLLRLVPVDERVIPCGTSRSVWVDHFRKQPPAVQTKIKAALSDAFGGEDLTRIRHAIRVLEPAEVLAAVGSPAAFIDGGAKMSVSAAAVLDAWSKRAPADAAKFACQLLPRAGFVEVEDAAYTAIARARAKCPAVAAKDPHWCRGAYRLTSRALETTETSVTEHTAFCAPDIGFVLASRTQNAAFDEAAFDALCAPLAKDSAAD